MADHFHGLDKDILFTNEQQLAASTTARPFLNDLNQVELSDNTLENRNQLLHDHIEKFEQLGILTGRKSRLTFRIK